MNSYFVLYDKPLGGSIYCPKSPPVLLPSIVLLHYNKTNIDCLPYLVLSHKTMECGTFHLISIDSNDIRMLIHKIDIGFWQLVKCQRTSNRQIIVI